MIQCSTCDITGHPALQYCISSMRSCMSTTVYIQVHLDICCFLSDVMSVRLSSIGCWLQEWIRRWLRGDGKPLWYVHSGARGGDGLPLPWVVPTPHWPVSHRGRALYHGARGRGRVDGLSTQRYADTVVFLSGQPVTLLYYHWGLDRGKDRIMRVNRKGTLANTEAYVVFELLSVDRWASHWV